jgi:RNA 2',3'-cyclic 3'-phosphodiesterase
METKRLFVGIPLDIEILREVKEFIEIQQPQKGLRWTPIENIHITTCFIGDTDTHQVNTIISEIDFEVASIHPFNIVIDSFCFAPKQDPYMIWLRFKHNASFEKLVDGLHRKVLNKQAGTKDYVPHATLSRFKSTPPLINFDKSLETDQFVVNKLILWESELRPTGAVYSKIKTFSLK